MTCIELIFILTGIGNSMDYQESWNILYSLRKFLETGLVNNL